MEGGGGNCLIIFAGILMGQECSQDPHPKSKTTGQLESQPVFLHGDLFLGTFLFLLLRSVSVLSVCTVVPRAVKIDDTVNC